MCTRAEAFAKIAESRAEDTNEASSIAREARAAHTAHDAAMEAEDHAESSKDAWRMIALQITPEVDGFKAVCQSVQDAMHQIKKASQGEGEVAARLVDIVAAVKAAIHEVHTTSAKILEFKEAAATAYVHAESAFKSAQVAADELSRQEAHDHEKKIRDEGRRIRGRLHEIARLMSDLEMRADADTQIAEHRREDAEKFAAEAATAEHAVEAEAAAEKAEKAATSCAEVASNFEDVTHDVRKHKFEIEDLLKEQEELIKGEVTSPQSKITLEDIQAATDACSTGIKKAMEQCQHAAAAAATAAQVAKDSAYKAKRRSDAQDRERIKIAEAVRTKIEESANKSLDLLTRAAAEDRVAQEHQRSAQQETESIEDCNDLNTAMPVADSVSNHAEMSLKAADNISKLKHQVMHQHAEAEDAVEHAKQLQLSDAIMEKINEAKKSIDESIEDMEKVQNNVTRTTERTHEDKEAAALIVKRLRVSHDAKVAREALDLTEKFWGKAKAAADEANQYVHQMKVEVAHAMERLDEALSGVLEVAGAPSCKEAERLIECKVVINVDAVRKAAEASGEVVQKMWKLKKIVHSALDDANEAKLGPSQVHIITQAQQQVLEAGRVVDRAHRELEEFSAGAGEALKKARAAIEDLREKAASKMVRDLKDVDDLKAVATNLIASADDCLHAAKDLATRASEVIGKVEAHLAMFNEEDVTVAEKNDIRHKLSAVAQQARQDDEQVDLMLDELADILRRIRAAQGTLEASEQAGGEENRALSHVMQAASHVASCDDAVRLNKQTTAAAAKAAAKAQHAVDGTSEDEEVSRYEAIAVGAANKADGIHNDANNTTMQVGEQARQIEAIQRKAELNQLNDKDHQKVEKWALEAVKHSCTVAQHAKAAREEADKAAAAQKAVTEMLHLSGHMHKFESALDRIQKAVDRAAGSAQHVAKLHMFARTDEQDAQLCARSIQEHQLQANEPAKNRPQQDDLSLGAEYVDDKSKHDGACKCHVM